MSLSLDSGFRRNDGESSRNDESDAGMTVNESEVKRFDCSKHQRRR